MSSDYSSGENANHDASGPSKSDRASVLSEEPTTDNDSSLHPGELTFEEDTAGGMGRHLGVFSCTMLMFVEDYSCLVHSF
jgi:solute carrier family 7 (L-type amino acid transporter), member 9/15